MNLHENKDTFRNAVRAASDHFGVRDEFIEKDYWLTFLLKRLSLSPIQRMLFSREVHPYRKYTN